MKVFPRSIFLFLLSLFFSNCNRAQSLPETTPERTISSFFDKYEKEGVDNALSYLFSENSDTSVARQINELKESLGSGVSLLGKYEGKELIAQKFTAKSLVFYSYMVKHQKQPLRFIFIFYKPSNTWKLHKFKFDINDLENELEETGRLYFLK